jgi:acetyl esterase
MPLDPQVSQWLAEAAAAGIPPMNQLPVEEARANLLAGSQLLQPLSEIESVRDLIAQSPAGPIPLRHFAPSAESAGVMVYFHGGGWVVGSRETHDVYCRDLAAQTGLQVVSVDYRLAPEFLFPAAAEDCYFATRWVAEHLDQVNGLPGELVVAGDSAGGNLAAVTSLLARDQGGPKITGQVLVYPITDHDFTRDSYRANANGFHLSRDLMIWFWDQYAPGESVRDHWMASPIRATSLADLPPTFIMTAEFDPLRDEGEEYGRRLAEAGVPTTVKRYDGMIHGFVRRTEWQASRDALQDVASAVMSYRSTS